MGHPPIGAADTSFRLLVPVAGPSLPSMSRASRMLATQSYPPLDWFQLPQALQPWAPDLAGMTWARCPNGHYAPIPGTLTNVRLRGNGRNLVTTCPTCRVEFDAAPGEDVIVDTVGGRLQVRQLVKAARGLKDIARNLTVEDVAALRVMLATRGSDDEGELTGPLAEWAERFGPSAKYLIDKFGDLIIGLLVIWGAAHVLGLGGSSPQPQPIHIDHLDVHIDHEPSDEELERIIRRAVEASTHHKEAP